MKGLEFFRIVVVCFITCFITKAQTTDPQFLVNIQTASQAEIDAYLPADIEPGMLVFNTTENQLEVRLNSEWRAVSATPSALTLTKATIRSINRSRVVVQAEANVNTGAFTITPASFALNQTGATLAGTSITNLVGNVRFVFQPNLTSGVQRSNLNCTLLRNGAIIERVRGTNYMRNLGNHNNSSSNWIFEVENALATDTFQFALEQEANGGAVQLLSNGVNNSYIFIEQYNDVEVVTDASAPVNLAIAQGPTGPIGPSGPQGPAGSVINSPLDIYHAAGNVQANGLANYILGGNVIRTAVGRYTVTFANPHPNGAEYPIILTQEQNAGADDYTMNYLNATANGFDIQVGEQDNGGDPGVFIDTGFSFYIPF